MLIGGVVLLFLTSDAFADATMTVSPDTGLTNGQSVTITGSGFSASSPGNMLECNNDPNQPTVSLPSPVSSDVSVGCSAPSYNLVTTKSDGTFSATYKVVDGTVGPPCGSTGDIITTCPSTDSAGLSPAADAANYPCPPTAAEQAAGITCSLSFGDFANDSAQATIFFQGESTTTTTAPVGTTTTTATVGTTTTTSAGATTSTTTSSTSVSATTTSSTAAAGVATSSSSSGSTSSASGELAFTGPGPRLTWMLVTGVALTGTGSILWLGWSLLYLRRRREGVGQS